MKITITFFILILHYTISFSQKNDDSYMNIGIYSGYKYLNIDRAYNNSYKSPNSNPNYSYENKSFSQAMFGGFIELGNDSRITKTGSLHVGRGIYEESEFLGYDVTNDSLFSYKAREKMNTVAINVALNIKLFGLQKESDFSFLGSVGLAFQNDFLITDLSNNFNEISSKASWQNTAFKSGGKYSKHIGNLALNLGGIFQYWIGEKIIIFTKFSTQIPILNDQANSLVQKKYGLNLKLGLTFPIKYSREAKN